MIDITEPAVIDALRSAHAAPEWAFFDHVRNATGWDGKRCADAIALNLYPSRGMELHGFEVKTDRGDWLREMKDPDKAEAVARYCDRWWIVAPVGVVVREELPLGWGLRIFPGLGRAVEAGQRAPVPLDRPFVAAIARAAAASVRIAPPLNDSTIEILAREIAERDARRIEEKIATARARARSTATRLRRLAADLDTAAREPDDAEPAADRWEANRE